MNSGSNNRSRAAILLAAGVACLIGLAGAWNSSSGTGAADSTRQVSFPGPMAAEVPLDVDDFGEGWNTSVKYPQQQFDATCRLWVENGWLHAARESDVGVVWRVAMSPVISGAVPRIATVSGRPAIEISYGDGGAFVRDNSVVLRVLRPSSGKERPTFKADDVLKTPFEQAGQCGRPDKRMVTAAIKDDAWYCVTSGPSVTEFDAFIRLNAVELREPKNGFGNMADDQRQAFHGECWAVDDGELLVARYNCPFVAQMELNQKKIRDTMSDNVPPEFEAAQWFNVEEPLSMSGLEGKVVLLDFWATTCGPCVKKLPDAQALHDKYGDLGLVVIGIHTAETLGACEKFVKSHDYTFPIMLDSGKTAGDYGVSSNPTYFLISREGKVVSGYESRTPSDETIAALLQQQGVE